MHHRCLIKSSLIGAMQLEKGIHVADVGCGQALTLELLGARFPKSTFVGLDLSEEALATGRASLASAGVTNVTLTALDCTRLEQETHLMGVFDWVFTMDAIHDQGSPATVLKGIHAMLKDDGQYSMVEPAASSNPAENAQSPFGASLYTISLLHCMPVSLAQPQGVGLGAAWGHQQACDYLARAGFEVHVSPVAGDYVNTHFLCTKTIV